MAGDELARAVLGGEREVVVLDVEATCWKEGVFSRRKETIEIGAVRYRRGMSAEAIGDVARAPGAGEFVTFVRPLRYPRLSSFCRSLTGIEQSDVDRAPTFPAALLAFLEWAPPLGRLVLASWSHYDVWQLELDLELHGLPKPPFVHLDVKKLAGALFGTKSFEDTARAFGIELAEHRHRALADARATAHILDRLLGEERP